MVFSRRSTCLAFVLVASALSLSAQDFQLDWFTIDGGGGPAMNNVFELDATLGQPDAGVMTNDVFQIQGGFWPAALMTGPFITRQPADTNVDAGANVTFSVEVSGTPPFIYQWRLNGVALPGATNSTLTLTNVQLANGGNYTVLVGNDRDIVSSLPARLFINGVIPLPGANPFASRVSLPADQGVIFGTNHFATLEAGEPPHADKLGGKSVWHVWQPVANGIATVQTVGSDFDTLLAVYTGSNLAALTGIASDDDRGGFYTSSLQFNAVAGTEYHIAVDGFAGDEGTYILRWSLELTNATIPVITLQPTNQTVLGRRRATFSVTADAPVAGYQWFFNGVSIEGATAPTFIRSNVLPQHVGYYTVRLSNSQARVIESLPATLEIGPEPSVQSQDKLEDLFLNDPPSAPGPLAAQAAAGTPGFIPLSAGTILTHYINITTNSGTSPSDINICGLFPHATRWLDMTSTVDRVCFIDTCGSTVSHVISVYRRDPAEPTTQYRVLVGDCTNAPCPNTIVARFEAVARLKYYVVADTAETNGLISFNISFGLEPFRIVIHHTLPVPGGGPLAVLRVTGSDTNGVVLEAARDFGCWAPVMTNPVPRSLLIYPVATNSPSLFFRAFPFPREPQGPPCDLRLPE